MGQTVNIFSHYVPSIGDVKFDAEFSFNLTTTSLITDYPLETGFLMTNAVIQMPTTFSVRLAVGQEPLTDLLSDPLDTIANAKEELLAGLVSNVIDSNILNLALGLVSDNLFKSYSRGGETFAKLQAVQLIAEPFDMVIHEIGVLKNVLIKSISIKEDSSTEGAIYFDVSMKQSQSKKTPRAVEESSDKVNMGEAKVTNE